MADKTNLELEKTLQVDGQNYNINAVQADKVANKLTVEKIKLLTDDSKPNTDKVKSDFFEFDGSTNVSAVLVPATGGRFSGRITVPSGVSDDTLNKDGDTVLSYNDTVSKVVDRLLNTSVMATWDSTSSTLTFTDTKIPAVNGICVVLGQEIGDTGLKTFIRYNNSNWVAATSENPPEQAPKWLPNYLYICTDTGNLYLGSFASKELTDLLLVGSITGKDIIPGTIYIDKTHWIVPKPKETNDSNIAEYATYSTSGFDAHNSDITNVNGLWFADAIKSKNEGIIFMRNEDGLDVFDLTKVKKDGLPAPAIGDRVYADDGKLYFEKNVKYYDPNTNKDFNDLNDAGNNGEGPYEVFHSGSDQVIPVKNGGTGATTATDARTNLEITPANIGAAKANHTHNYAGSSTAGGVANSALKATNDSDNKQINKTYYRSASNTSEVNTITIASSTAYPTGIPSGVGKNGDIIILY